MKYILVADDEPMNRDIICEMLGDTYEVVCVEDGQACLQCIQQRLPDLLLLDVAMPYLGGMEVCRRLRAEPRTSGIPVFMLSGFAAQEDIDSAIAVGADKYITKPFSPKALLKAIKEYLHE